MIALADVTATIVNCRCSTTTAATLGNGVVTTPPLQLITSEEDQTANLSHDIIITQHTDHPSPPGSSSSPPRAAFSKDFYSDQKSSSMLAANRTDLEDPYFAITTTPLRDTPFSHNQHSTFASSASDPTTLQNLMQSPNRVTTNFTACEGLKNEGSAAQRQGTINNILLPKEEEEATASISSILFSPQHLCRTSPSVLEQLASPAIAVTTALALPSRLARNRPPPLLHPFNHTGSSSFSPIFSSAAAGRLRDVTLLPHTAAALTEEMLSSSTSSRLKALQTSSGRCHALPASITMLLDKNNTETTTTTASTNTQSFSSSLFEGEFDRRRRQQPARLWRRNNTVLCEHVAPVLGYSGIGFLYRRHGAAVPGVLCSEFAQMATAKAPPAVHADLTVGDGSVVIG